MTTWTRITDPDDAITRMPAWFATKMLGVRGAYGFLLTTGDVVRVSRVVAIHASSDGGILLDLLLDHAGVPDGVDLAWRTKHYLGAPVPGAHLATLNLSQVVIAIELTAIELAETANDDVVPASDSVRLDEAEADGEPASVEPMRIA